MSDHKFYVLEDGTVGLQKANLGKNVSLVFQGSGGSTGTSTIGNMVGQNRTASRQIGEWQKKYADAFSNANNLPISTIAADSKGIMRNSEDYEPIYAQGLTKLSMCYPRFETSGSNGTYYRSIVDDYPSSGNRIWFCVNAMLPIEDVEVEPGSVQYGLCPTDSDLPWDGLSTWGVEISYSESTNTGDKYFNWKHNLTPVYDLPPGIVMIAKPFLSQGRQVEIHCFFSGEAGTELSDQIQRSITGTSNKRVGSVVITSTDPDLQIFNSLRCPKNPYNYITKPLLSPVYGWKRYTIKEEGKNTYYAYTGLIDEAGDWFLYLAPKNGDLRFTIQVEYRYG